jgi:hypothetical protein
MKTGLMQNVNISQHLKIRHMKECNKGAIHEMLWTNIVQQEEREEGKEGTRRRNGNMRINFRIWNTSEV